MNRDPCATSPIKDSEQLIISITADDKATDSELSYWEKGANGFAPKKVFAGKVGRSGLSQYKREGDGNAPAGVFDLYSAFGLASKIKGKLPYTPVDLNSHCIDDVKHPQYNRILHNYDIQKDASERGVAKISSENLKKVGMPYEYAITVNHNGMNDGYTKRGKGSCIFLHVWKKDQDNKPKATAGCTSMSRDNMRMLTTVLDPAKKPRLIQFTKKQYLNHKEKWCLPKISD